MFYRDVTSEPPGNRVAKRQRAIARWAEIGQAWSAPRLCRLRVIGWHRTVSLAPPTS